ncbi:MAG: DUF192 domain-containing protein [Terracidiphilus sp.]
MNLFERFVSKFWGKCAQSRQEMPGMLMRVLNLNRNSILATSLEVADSSARRNRGLLGKERLKSGEGLWIRPCEAVHTFWMRFSIDLVYIDRKYRIRKLCHAVPPWRLSVCLMAHSVLELPAGTIQSTNTEVDDVLDISIAPSIAK